MALHGTHINQAKLTAAALAKAKNSKNPAERKRATFAQNARRWNHGGKSKADKLYGTKE